MKNIFLLLLPVLFVMEACTNVMSEPLSPENTGSVSLSIYPYAEPQTRTSFVWDESKSDSPQYITWSEDDNVAIYLTETVSATKYLEKSTFWIDNEDLGKPVFKGTIPVEKIISGNTLYVVYPTSASFCEDDVREVRIKLPGDQRPTQTGFDGRADVMLGLPYTFGEDVQDGISNLDVNLKFAHLFGFLRLTFDVPEYKDEIVERVILTPTGDKTDMAGYFIINLQDGVNQTPVLNSEDDYSVSKISLSYQEQITLKDLNAWFVVNPGSYDVNITVVTQNNVLSFNRSGLTITRAEITEGTVTSAKDAATPKSAHITTMASSHGDVVLFEYNGNLLSSTWQTPYERSEMVYSDGRITSCNIRDEVIKFNWDGSGRISQILCHYLEYLVEHYTFSYQGENKFSITSYFADTDIERRRKEFIYTDGALTKIDFFQRFYNDGNTLSDWINTGTVEISYTDYYDTQNIADELISPLAMTYIESFGNSTATVLSGMYHAMKWGLTGTCKLPSSMILTKEVVDSSDDFSELTYSYPGRGLYFSYEFDGDGDPKLIKFENNYGEESKDFVRILYR